MNKAEAEMAWLCAACVVGPVIGCGIAIPIGMFFNSFVLAMVLGTVITMSIYIGTCRFHSKAYRNEKESDDGSAD